MCFPPHSRTRSRALESEILHRAWVISEDLSIFDDPAPSGMECRVVTVGDATVLAKLYGPAAAGRRISVLDQSLHMTEMARVVKSTNPFVEQKVGRKVDDSFTPSKTLLPMSVF